MSEQTQTAEARAMALLDAAPVDYERLVSDMTLQERREAESHLDAVAVRAAALSAYLAARCLAPAHDPAFAHQLGARHFRRRAQAVRKAIGFTHAEAGDALLHF